MRRSRKLFSFLISILWMIIISSHFFINDTKPIKHETNEKKFNLNEIKEILAVFKNNNVVLLDIHILKSVQFIHLPNEADLLSTQTVYNLGKTVLDIDTKKIISFGAYADSEFNIKEVTIH